MSEIVVNGKVFTYEIYRSAEGFIITTIKDDESRLIKTWSKKYVITVDEMAAYLEGYDAGYHDGYYRLKGD